MASVAHSAQNLCDVRSWIDDFAAQVRETDPTCRRCRKPMKLRRGVTGSAFWDCSSFPSCRRKRDAQMELVQALSYESSQVFGLPSEAERL
jgi:ssDNA-binding Zn-finger/Zn-ribbon topoisomerase 1